MKQVVGGAGKSAHTGHSKMAEDLYVPEYHLAPGESPSQAEIARRGCHVATSHQSDDPGPLPPTFTSARPGVVTSPGSPTTLQCFIKANPLPKVQWFHNGVECTDQGKYCFLTKASSWCLLVEDIGSDDGGEYRIVASNMHGIKEFTFHVTLLDPLPPSEFVHTHCIYPKLV